MSSFHIYGDCITRWEEPGEEALLFFCVGTVFQFSYTAVFGAYTAFIFIRTGDAFLYSFNSDAPDINASFSSGFHFLHEGFPQIHLNPFTSLNSGGNSCVSYVLQVT